MHGNGVFCLALKERRRCIDYESIEMYILGVNVSVGSMSFGTSRSTVARVFGLE